MQHQSSDVKVAESIEAIQDGIMRLQLLTVAGVDKLHCGDCHRHISEAMGSNESWNDWAVRLHHIHTAHATYLNLFCLHHVDCQGL